MTQTEWSRRGNESNRTEQESEAGNEENGSHRPENSPGEGALNASLQPKCQHISAEYTNTDCDCVVPNGGKQDVGKSDKLHENEEIADFQEDSYRSDVNLPPEESEGHVVLTGPGTGHSAEEEAEEAKEQDVEPSCSENDEEEEEGKGAEEEEDEEEQKSSPDFSIHQHPHTHNPSNISITPSTFTRATFSPGSPPDKQIQLPALFSGLRVLRKGVVGPGHDTVSHIKPQSLGERRATVPERPEDARVQGNFLDQISQFSESGKESRREGGEDGC